MVDVLGGVPRIVKNEIRGGAVMNDLAASLANFGIYTAIARANVKTDRYMSYRQTPWLSCTRGKVQITHIYVYVKDIYSFNDESSTSQYLGHWNRQGVIIAYDEYAAYSTSFELSNSPRMYLSPVPGHLDKPVDIASKLKEKEVFYPVRNRNFNQ